ncbi:MAG: hypothetical protein E6J34_12760 [Chloroflexi bacterium]|nr:MAG: hypothetical protein E6J34_12760 [Chloroflexota bacterium]
MIRCLRFIGIALLMQSSQYAHTQNVAGTIAYMAPEQMQAHPLPASDQYALAIVVYEWLSGQRPFQGSYTEVAVKRCTYMGSGNRKSCLSPNDVRYLRCCMAAR